MAARLRLADFPQYRQPRRRDFDLVQLSQPEN
jgi:hypothetical protein